MNKYLYIFCICFKLSELNFLEYCTFNTIHDLIYGSFDKVYASWEMTDFVCKKMLEYHVEKLWSEKKNSVYSARA